MPIGPAIPGRKLEKGGALLKSGRMKRLRESKEAEGMVLTDYLEFLNADFTDHRGTIKKTIRILMQRRKGTKT